MSNTGRGTVPGTEVRRGPYGTGVTIKQYDRNIRKSRNTSTVGKELGKITRPSRLHNCERSKYV
jgi:hypothetical protein